MKQKTDCPFCEGQAEVQTEEVTRKYKGKDIIYNESFYKCPCCGYEFTNTEIDTHNQQEVKKAYGVILDKLAEFMKKNY